MWIWDKTCDGEQNSQKQISSELDTNMWWSATLTGTNLMWTWYKHVMVNKTHRNKISSELEANMWWSATLTGTNLIWTWDTHVMVNKTPRNKSQVILRQNMWMMNNTHRNKSHLNLIQTCDSEQHSQEQISCVRSYSNPRFNLRSIQPFFSGSSHWAKTLDRNPRLLRQPSWPLKFYAQGGLDDIRPRSLIWGQLRRHQAG